MKSRDTLFRYLTLIQLIPREPSYRATTTLAMLLEERGFTSEIRTLQRDLEKLSTFFPIVCDKSGKPYRWAFDRGYKSALPAMDTPTALALILTEEYLQNLLPQSTSVQLRGQFEAARKHLDQLRVKGFSHWSDRVKAIPNGKALIPAPIDPIVWERVSEALLKSTAIDVKYLSKSQKRVSPMTLHPLAFVTRGTVSYLVATVNDYEDIRHFVLHRIKEIKESRQSFRSRKDFDLDEYLSTGVFGYLVDPESVALEAYISSDVAWKLEETPLSLDQSIGESNEQGWHLLKVNVPNDQETFWWVRGLGPAVDVIKPKEWREAILRDAQLIVDRAPV